MLKISVDDEAGKWHKSGLYIENRAPKCYFGQKMKTLVFGRWRASSETKAETVCFVITSQHHAYVGRRLGASQNLENDSDGPNYYLPTNRGITACQHACISSMPASMSRNVYGGSWRGAHSGVQCIDLLKCTKKCVFMLLGCSVDGGIARL